MHGIYKSDKRHEQTTKLQLKARNLVGKEPNQTEEWKLRQSALLVVPASSGKGERAKGQKEKGGERGTSVLSAAAR